MIASSRVWTIGLLLAGLVAAPGRAADMIKASASLNGQSATFAHGLGSLATDHAVTIGFFSTPLGAADQATALKEDFLNVGGDAPHVVLRLSFPEGAKNASPLAMCEIDYFNYKDGIHQYQNMASACGVVDLAGDLRVGGIVHGKLKGSEKNDAGKTHTWDLEFTTTLRAGH